MSIVSFLGTFFTAWLALSIPAGLLFVAIVRSSGGASRRATPSPAHVTDAESCLGVYAT